MFEKILEFKAAEDYLKHKPFLPEPIKLNIPEWYKKIKHNIDLKTIKGCMPFLDTLTTGYVLKTPIDFRIQFNCEKDKERFNCISSLINHPYGNFANLNSESDNHPINQVGKECPYTNKNKDLPFLKILNPWKITTPPGYSCLFVPPLNNTDDKFSIIPGIVDTDTFPLKVNFPIIINGDKYPVLDTIIKMGTPYVQVIPFKRESWKMKIKSSSRDEDNSKQFNYQFKMINVYKEKWWNKKSWK
jgi:hypothetical protein|tara:strand:- start:260 stop:991 length:732 start_codon:yes stop_codon:yes gene_type:complete